MKIILSRKGFDSQNGGQPSPIMPDKKTMLSLPIPLPGQNILYNELSYNNKSYLEIIQELKPNTKILEQPYCHLDPDIRKDVYKNRLENWKPIFGQCDAAQGHLNEIEKDDIFLFFGWFRETEYKSGKLTYKVGSQDLHIIYGYLQVACKYKNGDEKPFPEYASLHPHAMGKFKNSKNNCIYIAKDNLSLNENLKGADTLNYNKNLVLTKQKMTRSKWDLPDFFKQLKISYHNENSFKKDYFQSAKKGQEFIMQANDELINWTKNLIENN